jgi:sulfonate transport system ATP-binding protein
VTHDVDEAIALADRIVVLESGRVSTVRTVARDAGSTPGSTGSPALRRELLAALGVAAGPAQKAS